MPRSKTTLMRMLERQHGGADIRDLIQREVRRTGSVEAAAAHFGISKQSLYQWIDDFGGERRTVTEVVFPAFGREAELVEAV